jgi:hypothetical protein
VSNHPPGSSKQQRPQQQQPGVVLTIQGLSRACLAHLSNPIVTSTSKGQHFPAACVAQKRPFTQLTCVPPGRSAHLPSC